MILPALQCVFSPGSAGGSPALSPNAFSPGSSGILPVFSSIDYWTSSLCGSAPLREVIKRIRDEKKWENLLTTEGTKNTELNPGSSGILPVSLPLNTEHWILNTEYWTLNTEYWILNTEYWILNTELPFPTLWFHKSSTFSKFLPFVPSPFPASYPYMRF